MVVGVDAAAISFDVADRKGKLFEVHSDTTPKVGAKLKLATKKLANGTLSAVRVVTVAGSPQTKVTAQGVVDFVDEANARYALSVRGGGVAPGLGGRTDSGFVRRSGDAEPAPDTHDDDHAHDDHAQTPTTTTPTTTTPTTTTPMTPTPTPMTPTPTTPTPTTPTPTTPTITATFLPSVGQRLRVVLSLPPPSAVGSAAILRESHRTSRGAARPPLELAGLLTTIDEVKRTVAISADGLGLSSDTILLSFPASLVLKKFSLPEAVVAHATVSVDGTYALTGVAADKDATAADDPRNAVGDFRPHTAKRARASSR